MNTFTLANGRVWRRQIRPRWHPEAGETEPSGERGLSVGIDRFLEYAAQPAGLDESPVTATESAVEHRLTVGDAHVTWIEMPLMRTDTKAVAHSLITWPDTQAAPPEGRLAELFSYVDENGQRLPTTKRAWMYSESSADVIAIFSAGIAADIRTQVNENHRN